MDVSQLFIDRLFSQWRDATNINAILAILADGGQDTYDVCEYILDNFSIDDAEGEQLDFLGELIGVSRPRAQETRLFTLCQQGEVRIPSREFGQQEEIDIIVEDTIFAVGDIGDFLVAKSGGITIARAEIVTFTALTEIGVEVDYGIFPVGLDVELESTPATNSTISDVDYFPSGVTYDGGYLPAQSGLQDQTDLNADMSDADFRYLIRQKAASYRKKMTREILFNYLIAFGGRCKIDDDTTFYVEIDPIRYQDFTHGQREYIVSRGFKPAGVHVQFSGNLRNEDSI